MRGKLLKCALLATVAVALSGCGDAFTVKPLPVRLDVMGRPEGAKVSVDGTSCGTLRGEAPCVVTPLAPGRHLLHVEAPFHRPFDAYVHLDESARLVSKTVDLEPECGFLLVQSAPTGATVTCRGLALGTTPLLVTTLPCGQSHTLELSRNGYQRKSVEVRMENRAPVLCSQDLVLDSGILECVTEPAGATVLVNGIEQGTTPVEVMIPRGRVELTFRREGYKDVVQDVRMSVPGERRKLELKLDGRPACLTVTTEPDKAKVYLDGNYKGVSPVTVESVVSGTHEVRVELSGHAPVSRTVQLANGETVTKTFKMESVLGRIEVTTTPPGAKISLDGKRVGFTHGDAGCSQILLVENVEAGEHAVLAQLDGYYDQSLKVVVGAKETKQLPFTLRRNFTPDTEIETSQGVVRGVLKKEMTNAEQIFLEISPGIQRGISRDTIRSIKNIKK